MSEQKDDDEKMKNEGSFLPGPIFGMRDEGTNTPEDKGSGKK